MARKPRLHVPGGLYHVILRGNARQNVFFSAGDRHFFHELISEVVARFRYLITNHHDLMQVGEIAWIRD